MMNGPKFQEVVCENVLKPLLVCSLVISLFVGLLYWVGQLLYWVGQLDEEDQKREADEAKYKWVREQVDAKTLDPKLVQNVLSDGVMSLREFHELNTAFQEHGQKDAQRKQQEAFENEKKLLTEALNK